MLKDKVFDSIREIRRLGLTILLVEQDVRATFELADRVYVLAHGRVAAQGSPKELMKDTDVREIYLGV